VFARHIADGKGVAPADYSARDLARLADIPVDCTVELGRHMIPLRDALELRRGSFVPTNRLADEPVELRLGGRLAAYGELVVIDDQIGIRVSELAR
jgi:flagellar motor switch protein FliN/FliY